MKKIVTIITSALALIYLPAWAGTWKDDFSDGNLDGWREVIFGPPSFQHQWNIVQGRLKGELIVAGAPAATLLLPPMNIQGEDFEVKHMIISTTGGLAIVGTVMTDKNKRYIISLTPGGFLSISKWENGPFPQNLFFVRKGIAGGFVPDRSGSGQIRVKFKRPRFEIHFSGSPFFEFDDNDFQPEAVGFYLQAGEPTISRFPSNAEGFFDDFVLSGPDIPDKPVAVEPKSKLSTTWGKIKAKY